MYSGMHFLLGVLISFLYVIAVATIIIVMFSGQGKNKTVSKKQNTPAFFKLRDRMEQTTRLLAEAGINLEQLHLDLEDYEAESQNQGRISEEKYYRILSNIFLLLDHLENTLKDEKINKEIGWVYRIANRILEDEDIEELPVAKHKDLFSGVYHKHVGSQPHELPKGTVLEVTRKGYYAKNKTGKAIILRPAEVIISNGQVAERTDSEAPKEVE